jgi:hypothetical protein
MEALLNGATIPGPVAASTAAPQPTAAVESPTEAAAAFASGDRVSYSPRVNAPAGAPGVAVTTGGPAQRGAITSLGQPIGVSPAAAPPAARSSFAATGARMVASRPVHTRR